MVSIGGQIRNGCPRLALDREYRLDLLMNYFRIIEGNLNDTFSRLNLKAVVYDE